MSKSDTEMKTEFLTTLITGSLVSASLDLMSETLKGLVPSSKKKKKGANPVFDEIQASIISPIRQVLKEWSTSLAVPRALDLTQRQEILTKHLQDAEASLGFKITGPIEIHALRKVQEISKEEKLATERLRDIRINLSKRLKEIATNGAFL